MIANESEFRMNVEIIGSKCCVECDKIDGNFIPLDEAIKKPPLPHRQCIRENGCICLYGFQVARDTKGRALTK